MPAVEVITSDSAGNIFTASSFLAYLRRSSEHWWQENSNQLYCDWVYRGHWDASWKLVPTAGRQEYEGTAEFKRLATMISEYAATRAEWSSLTEMEKDKSLRCWAHVYSVQRFLTLARELRFDVREPPVVKETFDDWLKNSGHKQFGIQNGLSAAFLQNDGPVSDFNFHTDPAVSLAQHHGVATFLLDWTDDPLTACYFASTKPNSVDAPEGLAVWALNASALKYCQSYIAAGTQPCQLNLLRPPKSNNEYLAHQSGVLTYITNPDLLWDQNQRFPDLESVFQLCDPEYLKQAMLRMQGFSDEASKLQHVETTYASLPRITFLRKVILGPSQLLEFRRLLFREGISKAHMMPTLDNVAATAKASLINDSI